MPANAFTQWQFIPPYGLGQPGAPAGSSMDPYFRDILDARRSMFRRTPEAEYPDGYLGTITSRREDRLLDSLKNRLTQRSYQRGVHKGERIDPDDYFWPAEFKPDRGLRAVAAGVRQAPVGQVLPHLTGEGWIRQPGVAPAPRGSQSLLQIMDPKRGKQLAQLAPDWR